MARLNHRNHLLLFPSRTLSSLNKEAVLLLVRMFDAMGPSEKLSRGVTLGKVFGLQFPHLEVKWELYTAPHRLPSPRFLMGIK